MGVLTGHKAKIEALEKENQALQDRIQELETENAALKAVNEVETPEAAKRHSKEERTFKCDGKTYVIGDVTAFWFGGSKRSVEEVINSTDLQVELVKANHSLIEKSR